MLLSVARFSLSASAMAELSSISRMGSASLREATKMLLKSGGISQNEKAQFAVAAAQRAVDIRPGMRQWDLVSVLQAHVVCAVPDELRTELSEMVRGKLSGLAPKDLLNLLLVADDEPLAADVRHWLILSVQSSMYIDEFIGLVRVLARRKDASDSSLKFVQSVCVKLLSNDSLMGQMRFLHACEILGALGHLGSVSRGFHDEIVNRATRELDLMPMQELWRTITGFSRLCFSSKRLEDLALAKLVQTLSLIDSQTFDQVSAPIEFLQFLRYQNLLSPAVLLEACRWAGNAVYRPSTRTEAHRRPTIFEVTLLADLCREFDLQPEVISKAATVTLTSKAGTVDVAPKPKPLRYRRRRAYLRIPDGYVATGVKPVSTYSPNTVSLKSNDAAFAPKLRTKGKPLWQTRSNAWFFRK